MPVQTSINTRLARTIRSTWAASLVSFSVGTVALGIVVAVSRPALAGIAWGTLPWWMWIGGLCGVVFLTFNMVLMRNLGAATAVVIPVVGQVFGGLIIDAFALAGAPHHPLSILRLLGAGLVVLGAATTVIYRRHGHTITKTAKRSPAGSATTPTTILPTSKVRSRFLVAVLAVLGVISGALSALQTTVNGALGSALNSPLTAALISFAVGTAALAVINTIRGLASGRGTPAADLNPVPIPVENNAKAAGKSVATASTSQATLAGRARRLPPAAQLTGGLLGAAFVFGSALCAPILGTATTVSVILLGQLASSMIIDHTGALGATQRRATRTRLIGCVIVLIGVGLVRLVG